ncbi:MAG: YkgJ family cysteine cluster protein, partial [Fimbriimonas ginsengisoli]|nr:YkgJ family cysteine cluster protein [Fimbriimonas ginsengisoli]
MSEASSGSNVEFAGIPATRQFDLQRSDDFSYVCNRCKRCCHNKAIPLNPYEVVRLAHRLGVSTGEFIEQSTLGGEGTFLRFHPPEEGGACVFLGEEGCSVHSDRPTACRVYPLGRWSAGPGV